MVRQPMLSTWKKKKKKNSMKCSDNNDFHEYKH